MTIKSNPLELTEDSQHYKHRVLCKGILEGAASLNKDPTFYYEVLYYTNSY